MKGLFRYILVCLILFACACTSAYAQYEGTSWEQRLGSKKDYDRNHADFLIWNNTYVMHMDTLFREMNANSDYANKMDYEKYHRTWNTTGSYKVWKNLTASAPYVDFRLFHPDYGADMLCYLIRTEQDQAVKALYFDELTRLSQFRIDHLDSINALTEAQDAGIVKKSTLADVKAWRAHFYFTEGKNIHERIYNKEQAYQYYKDAMEEVRSQQSVSGTEVEPYLIDEYFASCQDLYEVDNDKYLEQFLQDYLDMTSTCKRLYETASEEKDSVAASGRFYNYYNVYLILKEKFDASGASGQSMIERYYRTRLDEHKEDVGYLNNALSILMQYKCLPNIDMPSISEKYAQLAYPHEAARTRFTAIAYALLKKKESDDTFGDEEQRLALRQEMSDAFAEAERLSETDADKAYIAYLVGRSLVEELPAEYNTMIDEIKKWASNTQGAVINLEKAREIDRGHFGVAASRYAGDALYPVLRRYYEYIYAMPDHGIKDKSLRGTYEEMIELGNQILAYYGQINDDAHYAWDNKIYEQDGINIEKYAEGGISANIDNTNSFINWAKGRIKTATITAPNNPDHDPNHVAYHNYWIKKIKEKSFWTNKTETWKCEYCGRTFNSN